MRSILMLPAALAFAAFLPAQGVAFSTLHAYGNFAAEDAHVALKYIAAATPITTATTVLAQQGGASAQTALGPSSDGIVIREAGACVRTGDGKSAAGTTTSTSPNNIVRGPHSLLMKIGGDGGAVGKLVVGFAGTAERGSRGRVRIDIGNNGSDEFDQTLPSGLITKEFPIDSKTAVLVRISTEGLAEQDGEGKTGYTMDLKVLFLGVKNDDPCVATPFGTSCGSKLSVKDEVSGMQHKVTFDVAGALPSTFGVLHLGLRQANIQVPGTNCFVYTIPDVAIPHMTDANGNAQRVLFAKGPLAGIVFAQAASVQPHTRHFEASQGLKIDCGTK